MAKVMINQTPPTREQLARWQSQAKKIFEAFYETPLTMYQCSKRTGIERPNICRRVADWRETGQIKVVTVNVDPLTQRRAQFFSTNPRFWPAESNGSQLNFFD
jgi:hypothetical protein